MSATSKIQWTEKTWNPVRGCSIVSPGCVNCYAMKQGHRFSGMRVVGKGPERTLVAGPYHGLTKLTKAGPQWTGVVRTIDEALLEPLSWRTPARVFVNSMSDLFHEDVPDAFIDRVFAVMALAPRHTFQILTKRADRMRKYFDVRSCEDLFDRWVDAALTIRPLRDDGESASDEAIERLEEVRASEWPLPNVWLGVSVEDRQRRARIEDLRQTPAAVRFVSFEPLLEDVSDGLNLAGIHWGIWGGESGHGARPTALEWLERGVSACLSQGVRPFVKQLGAFVVSEERTFPADMMPNPAEALRRYGAPNGEVWAWRAGLKDRKGGDIAEFPERLKIRQFPEARP